MTAGALLAKLWRRPRARHLDTGARGERWAARHLKRKRYKVLARNLRTAVGEVDLLCLAPNRRTIVIVEVKTRSASRDGQSPKVAPELALNRAKRRKLLAVAQDLARRKKWAGRGVRIDLIAIDVDAGGKPTIRHHENAVTL